MSEQKHNWINTDKISKILRNRLVQLDNQKLLITSFYDSKQEKDLTEAPNCNGFGRIRHFRRVVNPNWPPDPLPIDPANNKIWSERGDEVQAQVFQIGACNWRCWYCFVDYPLLAADPNHSEFLSSDDLVNLYMGEKQPPKVIDLTGGHPELVPEWVPWMMKALQRRGLDDSTYLWSDDNLSVGYLWQYLNDDDIRILKTYKNYGRVGCFKGFDEISFSFNTGAAPQLFSRQFNIMAQLISLGLDLYGYVTFTTPDIGDLRTRMGKFVDGLQVLNTQFPLRVIPLEIQTYSTNVDRIDDIQRQALKNQYEVVEAWSYELERRFNPAELNLCIADVPLYF